MRVVACSSPLQLGMYVRTYGCCCCSCIPLAWPISDGSDSSTILRHYISLLLGDFVSPVHHSSYTYAWERATGNITYVYTGTYYKREAFWHKYVPTYVQYHHPVQIQDLDILRVASLSSTVLLFYSSLFSLFRSVHPGYFTIAIAAAPAWYMQ